MRQEDKGEDTGYGDGADYQTEIDGEGDGMWGDVSGDGEGV